MSTSSVDVDAVDRVTPLHASDDRNTQYTYTQEGGFNNRQYNAQTINQTFVPWIRDQDFIDRPQLKELERKLSVGNTRVALVGVGGVGKSQLAIEYCYRFRDQHLDTWVLWLHASSAARFDAEIRKLARDVGILERDDPGANIFARVSGWLLDKRNGKWLLVLDNVDDVGFLLEAPSADSNDTGYRLPRIRYLPVCEHGSMLITSRTRPAAATLVDDSHIIEVDQMNKQGAITLLNRKLGWLEDTEDTLKLAIALDCIPLALAQAAAYIKKRGPRCSVKEYLEKLASSGDSKTNILESASQEIRRDLEAQNSILRTWQISFDQICTSRPSAASLLSLISFYNHQDIPDLLPRASISTAVNRSSNQDQQTSTKHQDPATEPIDTETDYFEGDILMLQDYLFIRLTSSGTSFVMHRLVQLAARLWLESQGQYQHWASQSIKNLDEVFPSGDYANWKVCQSLYIHARSTLDIKLDDEEGRLRQASLLCKAAWFCWLRGSLSDAKTLAIASRETNKAILGATAVRTLSSQSVLASVLTSQGNYAAAESLIREVAAGFTASLGPKHDFTLTALCNLSDILHHRGSFKAAEELDRRVLEERGKTPGPDHPVTLSTVSHLALMQKAQQNYEEAEDMSRRAWRGSQKSLGPDHPFTLKTAGNLAEVLQGRGKFAEAEELRRSVLEGCARAFGEKHPSTFLSEWYLAEALESLGRGGEAALMYARAAEGLVEVLGREHLTALACRRKVEGGMAREGGARRLGSVLSEGWRARWIRWLPGGERM